MLVDMLQMACVVDTFMDCDLWAHWPSIAERSRCSGFCCDPYRQMSKNMSITVNQYCIVRLLSGAVEKCTELCGADAAARADHEAK